MYEIANDHEVYAEINRIGTEILQGTKRFHGLMRTFSKTLHVSVHCLLYALGSVKNIFISNDGKTFDAEKLSCMHSNLSVFVIVHDWIKSEIRNTKYEIKHSGDVLIGFIITRYTRILCVYVGNVIVNSCECLHEGDFILAFENSSVLPYIGFQYSYIAASSSNVIPVFANIADQNIRRALGIIPNFLQCKNGLLRYYFTEMYDKYYSYDELVKEKLTKERKSFFPVWDPIPTKREKAAVIISRAWFRCNTDPSYVICRNRLSREFIELSSRNGTVAV